MGNVYLFFIPKEQMHENNKKILKKWLLLAFTLSIVTFPWGYFVQLHSIITYLVTEWLKP